MIPRRSILLSSVLIAATSAASAAPFSKQAADWISLDKDLQPSQEAMTNPKLSSNTQSHLRQLWGRQNDLEAPADSIFVDGSETYWDENAQAWRFLGFYQDCDACAEDDDGDGEGDNSVDCVGNTICQRYALWAAYVDTKYEGNGAGEYMYYNRHTGRYNKEACKASSGSSRCVKMDCHEATTHFSLLGFFKEAQYDAFLESILQYQGDCVWNDDEYKFMQAVGGNGIQFPVECTAVENNNGESVYYDIQPTAGGNMNVALYQDNQCSQAHTGNTVTIDDIMSPTSSASTVSDELKEWNDGLDAFKICQPCKVHDIVSMIHKNTQANANGDRYSNGGGNNNDNDDNENGDEANGDDNAQDENGGFVCSSSDAVNQCMMFRQNTNMQTASYRDVMLAESQGTVNGIHVGKIMMGEPHKKKHMWLSIVLFLCSLALLAYAFMRLYHEDRINSELKEPLMEQESSAQQNSRNTKSSKKQSNQSKAGTSNKGTGDQANTDTNKNGSNASVNTDGADTKNTNGTKRSFWGRKRSKK